MEKQTVELTTEQWTQVKIALVARSLLFYNQGEESLGDQYYNLLDLVRAQTPVADLDLAKLF
jgi:hypothetical protein